MTCRDFAEFLGEYLAGSLPEAQVAVFEVHLAECPDCIAYLQTYQETIRLGKAACAHPDDEVPPEVPDELVQAILAARRHPLTLPSPPAAGGEGRVRGRRSE